MLPFKTPHSGLWNKGKLEENERGETERKRGRFELTNWDHSDFLQERRRQVEAAMQAFHWGECV